MPEHLVTSIKFYRVRQIAVAGFELNIDSSYVRTGMVKPEFDALRLSDLQIASSLPDTSVVLTA